MPCRRQWLRLWGQGRYSSTQTIFRIKGGTALYTLFLIGYRDGEGAPRATEGIRLGVWIYRAGRDEAQRCGHWTQGAPGSIALPLTINVEHHLPHGRAHRLVKAGTRPRPPPAGGSSPQAVRRRRAAHRGVPGRDRQRTGPRAQAPTLYEASLGTEEPWLEGRTPGLIPALIFY